MNEEKIDQILKNQATILSSLVLIQDIDFDVVKSLRDRVEETKEIMFPKEEQSLPDKTENALGRKRE